MNYQYGSEGVPGTAEDAIFSSLISQSFLAQNKIGNAYFTIPSWTTYLVTTKVSCGILNTISGPESE